jgi:hypothetical protein
MSVPENQLLLLKDHKEGRERPVFLVLTEQRGSDFTFYLRDDPKGDRIRRILRQESRQAGNSKPWAADAGDDHTGAATRPAQAAGEVPKQESSFSCRMCILHPLLDKDDFKSEDPEGKKVIFLQRLRAAKDEAADHPPYARLRRELKLSREALDEGKLGDEELLKIMVLELNGLLASADVKALFTEPATDEDQALLNQVDDPEAESKLGNYLRFCSLFKDAIVPIESRLRDGRVLAGLSYEGKFWSISFRKQETGTGYAPSTKTDGTLNSIEELCHALYEEIFYAVGHSEEVASQNGEGKETRRDGRPTGDGVGEKPSPWLYRERINEHREKLKSPEMSGLVVVAGSTNSAKSLVTRGLIHLYLENVLKGNDQTRRPHLVTFEDPIEKYLATEARTSIGESPPPDDAPKSLEGEIDYTPRQQKIDIGGLRMALRDALRQTPKVFFVGETRKKEDWHALIDFAGTGHLVITTAHAGSLIEAMHKIFLATGANTPADRNEVASRLLAVIHLKRAEVAGFEKVGVLVPALWRRVPRGLNALTAEGLASILPHSHSEEDNPCSCLGRKYFVEKLHGLANDRPPTAERFQEVLAAKARDFSQLRAADLKDPARLVARLHNHVDHLFQHLSVNLAAETAQLLNADDGSDQPSAALQQALVEELNRFLGGPSLFEPGRFNEESLSAEARDLFASDPSGERLVLLNRLLLEIACPDEIGKCEVADPAKFKPTLIRKAIDWDLQGA